MAGTVRLIFGALVLVVGFVLFLTIVLLFAGLFFMVIGVLLLAWGWSARADEEFASEQQLRASAVLETEKQMAAEQAAARAAASAAAAAQSAGGPSAPRYCPVCGVGNLRSAAFCQACGRPLPTPP